MQSSRFLKAQQGFTLLELMVTLTIAGILAAIAVPTMQSITINRHADRLANELQLDIMYARNHALSLNKNVTIKPLSGGWDTGWVVAQGTDVIRQKGSASAPMAKKAGEITSTFTTAAPLIFDRNGRVNNPSNSTNAGSFSINVADCTGDRKRTLQLNYIGQLQTINSPC